MSSYFGPPRRRRSVVSAAVAALTFLGGLAGPALAAAPASAASTLTVSGLVINTTLASGAKAVSVAARNGATDAVTQTSTDSSGHYSLNLAPDSYYLVCVNYTFGSGSTPDSRKDVKLSTDCDGVYVDSSAVAGENFTVEQVATLGGALSPAPGSPSTGEVTPMLFQQRPDGRWRRFNAAFDTDVTPAVAPSGSFRVRGVPDGTYRLCFGDDEEANLGCAGSTWLESARDITVRGTDDNSINASLASRGSIAGTVTRSADGVAVPDTSVRLFRERTVNGTKQWIRARVGDHSTSSSGAYGFSLPVGQYKVEFKPDDDESLLSQFYANASSLPTATPLTVQYSPSVTANAQLRKAYSISGTVDLPTGHTSDETSVTALDSVSGERRASTYVDDDGTYSLSGLAAGSYKVQFDRESGTALGAATFFDGVAENLGLGKAQTLVLGLNGSNASNVNAQITRGRVLTGKVVDADGAPLAFARVLAYTNDGSLVTRSVTTDGQGSFSLTGLTSGAYRLAVDDENGPGGLRFYDGTKDLTPDKAATVNTPTAAGTSLGTLVFGEAVFTPVAASPPTITGTPSVGSTLTATPGDWKPSGASYSYQWLANGTPIAGATGTTYKPVGGDFGRSIAVRVTASKPGYESGTATSAATSPIRITTITRGSVGIAGAAQVDQTLTATPTGWAPADVRFAYQWAANGAPVPGATAQTFTPSPSQVGQTIAVTVTGSREGSPEAAPVTSAATVPVAAGGLQVLRAPSIRSTAKKGKVKVKSVLAANAGVVSPAASVGFQWLRNGAAIPGANGGSYKLGKADKKKYVSLRVTYSRAGYGTVTWVTNRLGPVKK